ncbi:hypothetical protein CVT25_011701 [Psilocybe cyanescens]|uniref:Uncharacterized protein n=1 Tax=Psilocybe cyanescens TaxID=93625 RepID=A0A409WIQ1_PSICY|nr:hypothetical protein CVT25_011701 [Psilocybe cyanescens]
MSSAPKPEPSHHVVPHTISGEQPFLAEIWLVAVVLSSIAYGIEITLAIMTINALAKKSTGRHTSARLRTVLITIIAFLYNIVAKLKGATFQILAQPFSDMELIFVILATWCSYGLLIWRCTVLYQGISLPKRIVFLVFVSLLACVSLGFGFMGLLTMVPGVSGKWSGTNILTVFETVSFFVNGAISCLIIFRILYHQWRLRKVFGKGYGTEYTRIIVISIESSLMTLIWDGLIMILAFRLEGSSKTVEDLSLIILKLLLHFNIIAPILIIYRVAQGRAVSTGASVWSSPGKTTRMKIAKIRVPTLNDGPTFNVRATLQHPGSPGSMESFEPNSQIHERGQ